MGIYKKAHGLIDISPSTRVLCLFINIYDKIYSKSKFYYPSSHRSMDLINGFSDIMAFNCADEYSSSVFSVA